MNKLNYPITHTCNIVGKNLRQKKYSFISNSETLKSEDKDNGEII